jgi:membrane-associated protease RseP (regulator of RpoE activity)
LDQKLRLTICHMKTFIAALLLATAATALAQEAPKVRVEKRVVVIKDGNLIASPSDSVLKGFRIQIDSALSGTDLDLKSLSGSGADQLMVLRAPFGSGAMLGVRIAATEGVRGVTVQSVEPISTAAALGLQVGDVIAAVNGTPIEQPSDLVELIRSLEVGSAVDVRFRRDGAKNRARGYLIPAGGPSMLPSWVEGEPIRIELKEERE